MKPAKVIQFRPDSRRRDGFRAEYRCPSNLNPTGKFAGAAYIACAFAVFGIIAFKVWEGFQ